LGKRDLVFVVVDDDAIQIDEVVGAEPFFQLYVKTGQLSLLWNFCNPADGEHKAHLESSQTKIKLHWQCVDLMHHWLPSCCRGRIAEQTSYL